LATFLAVITCIVSLFAKERERPQNSQWPTWSLRTGILAIEALPVAWIALCLGLAMGAVNTFIAIFASSRGIENPGLYFAVQATALLMSRAFSGRLADRRGRGAAIIPGTIAMSIALATLPLARDRPHFMVTAALYGLGFGTAQPATMALLADHLHSEQQGLGVATYFMGYDGGIFLGSVTFGVVSQVWGFGVMWPVTAVCTLLGLVGLLGARRRRLSMPQ
jgi:MFS family permease